MKHRYWTDEKILEELRKLRDQGVPMNSFEIGSVDNPLLQAAILGFGSFRAALDVARTQCGCSKTTCPSTATFVESSEAITKS